MTTLCHKSLQEAAALHPDSPLTTGSAWFLHCTALWKELVFFSRATFPPQWSSPFMLACWVNEWYDNVSAQKSKRGWKRHHRHIKVRKRPEEHERTGEHVWLSNECVWLKILNTQYKQFYRHFSGHVVWYFSRNTSYIRNIYLIYLFYVSIFYVWPIWHYIHIALEKCLNTFNLLINVTCLNALNYCILIYMF